MAWMLAIITSVVCMISLLLMLRDMEGWDETGKAETPDEQGSRNISRAAIVYSVISIAVTVAMAAAFPSLYPDNSVWVNVKRMTLLAVLWPVAFIDFKTYRIPNLFVVFGLICRGVILVFEFFSGSTLLGQTLVSEIVAAVALLLATVLCALVVKNGIGFGDMKLFAVMGLMLGLEGIWGAVFLALIVSFFIAVYLLFTKKKTRKDVIPFGPAIVIGTYLSVFLSGM